jgi:O-acetyl-ADP-ribose deacetylase (regulator of RNase III)
VAAVTSAGDLVAGHIVHVVGPVFVVGGDNEDKLRRAVTAALDAALRLEASSVALPAISAGIYGYPPEEATLVIASEVAAWLGAHPGSFTDVRLVAFGATTADAFRAALRTQGS